MSQRSPAGDAISAVFVQIMYLNGLLMEKGDEMASVAGQTAARWRVLASIEDEAKTVAQMARDLGLARQSVQRIVDSLADAQLVSFIENPKDQRADLVVLKAAGKKALKAIQTRQIQWADQLGKKIGPKVLKEIQSSLDILLQGLKSVEP